MKAVFLLFTLALLYSSCEFDRSKFKSSGIAVTGKVGEILVVCEQDIWDSGIKACLDSNLTQFIMPYFPDVATFELIHKTPKHFTQGIKRYRNTMFINVDPNFKEEKGKIEKRVGVWATDQLVIDITANSYEQLEDICKRGLKSVHKEFDDFEWKRIMKYYAETPNPTIEQKVKANFGIHFALPDGAKLVTTRDNFFRIEFPSASRPIEFIGSGGEDNGAIFSGILVYQYDYTDSSQFELTNLLQARDTMLRYNVPYEYEGMYMGTQYKEMIYPEGTFCSNKSQSLTGFEMRGMFKFEGLGKHGPGGCFWAYHFVNPKTNKLVCVSGYVDAPSTTSWTQPLREVQAIWKSVEIK
jgi:Domain of unknown function (DUF4837)